MRAHRVLPAGWRPTAVIFLFVTAFDPWPTEARADEYIAGCLAPAMYHEARDAGRDGMAAVRWVVPDRAAALEIARPQA